ncbi:MAG TPA: 5-formyltetrahydrofolate cyclo-ligase [Pseudonocardiaceae bacterium]|nr:5-formyltetrahydrofolate cyclo-ligase [Pseudonocardiaceae bacterium]
MWGGYVDEIGKWEWRRRLLAARRAVPSTVREAEATALAVRLSEWFDPASRPHDQWFDPASRSHALGLPGTVCAYWPVGTEPGSPALLDGLVHRGCRVLLPVVRPRGPLDWAEYTGPGSLRAGPRGLREPAGPLLGCAAIATAVLVLVPALAVDQHGARLGRGGGYYDRTLPLAAPGTPLVAIVRDDEVLASLPVQPHDVPVTAALTPARGLIPLPY